jgi:serine/threonine protein kinase
MSIFIDEKTFDSRYSAALDSDGNQIQLGAGGFSKVFLFYDLFTKKPVAIKTMETKPDHLCGPDEISIKVAEEEIENNIKLKPSYHIIQLQSVYKYINEYREVK